MFAPVFVCLCAASSEGPKQGSPQAAVSKKNVAPAVHGGKRTAAAALSIPDEESEGDKDGEGKRQKVTHGGKASADEEGSQHPISPSASASEGSRSESPVHGAAVDMTSPVVPVGGDDAVESAMQDI